MPDVIQTVPRSDRFLLAVSFASFAVAGVSTGPDDALAPTLGATALAVAGVYALARYAGAVSRRTLALAALGYWLAFLAIAPLHAVGLETLGSIVYGPSEAIVLAVTAVTWATLLSACGTTAFLGFREYGSRAAIDAPEEQVLDGDTPSDY
ncbi:hypothetical protein ACFO5R_17205 [Halosolutus amylolyticus]|uniref:Uncharacterized protein n=1 Tax=Halosolutus amylolyticus TaxID=2932267 RepID=A0ABD5PT98_9EURY|nr:hypothetical protein [Halosolutus amylolyticus]